MAPSIVVAVIVGDAVTLLGLGVLAVLDQSNIQSHLITPADRLVNHQVIMTLLGATTVQVGTIAWTIARYLFPGRSRGD